MRNNYNFRKNEGKNIYGNLHSLPNLKQNKTFRPSIIFYLFNPFFKQKEQKKKEFLATVYNFQEKQNNYERKSFN